MVCHREKEGEVNSPTLLCLNQQALRLTAKMVGEWGSKLPALHDLQSVGQRKESRSLEYCDRMEWWEKEKVKWLAHRPLAQKCYFSFLEIWKESSVWGQKLAEKDADLQPTPGKVSRKKSKIVFGQESAEKDADSANSGDVTCP